MSIDRTGIANLALNHIGEPPIMDLTDIDSERARTITVVFDAAIKEMGRDHEWNCLKKRENIPRQTAPPDFGFQFQYELPTDLIRLLRLNGRDVRERTNLYEIEQRHILTDAEVAKIQYIAFIVDPTVYDPLFVEALAVLIASKVATTIRQDEQLKLALFQQYKTSSLPAARKVDGNERNVFPYDAREQSRWLNARKTGTHQGGIEP